MTSHTWLYNSAIVFPTLYNPFKWLITTCALPCVCEGREMKMKLENDFRLSDISNEIILYLKWYFIWNVTIEYLPSQE